MSVCRVPSYSLSMWYHSFIYVDRYMCCDVYVCIVHANQLGPNAEFNKEVGSEAMITAVPLKNWVIVFSRKDHSRAFEFINTVKKVCAPLGMDISEPQVRPSRQTVLPWGSMYVCDHL